MINDELYRQAVKLGACKEGLDKIPSSSERELVEAYKRHIEFSIDKGWPGEDFIKENFSADILHEKDVYVKESVNIASGNGVIVINSCEGDVSVSGYSVSTIYVRGDSDVHIICRDMARVHIYAYDNSRVHVEQGGASHVFCIKHGSEVLMDKNGDVIVKEK